MPNSISTDKRRYTYCEQREVFDWMAAVAKERGVDDVSVIVREATSAMYAMYKDQRPQDSLFAKRQKEKATERKRTARQIKAGTLSRDAAQKRNSAVKGAVKIVNLWPALRLHARRTN